MVAACKKGFGGEGGRRCPLSEEEGRQGKQVSQLCDPSGILRNEQHTLFGGGRLDETRGSTREHLGVEVRG